MGEKDEGAMDRLAREISEKSPMDAVKDDLLPGRNRNEEEDARETEGDPELRKRVTEKSGIDKNEEPESTEGTGPVLRDPTTEQT